MSEVHYDFILPLISEATQEGDAMRVVFRCPVSGTSVQAVQALQGGSRTDDSTGGVAKKHLKRNIGWGLRRSLARAVAGALGGGMGGYMVGNAASSTAAEVVERKSESQARHYSDDEKRLAICDAFQSVQHQFSWDAANNRFVAAAGAAQGGFMAQLAQHPLAHAYDQYVAARVLTEMAGADGDLGADERAFLDSFINPQVASVEAIVHMPKLTAEDLSKTSQGSCRETLLMLAWALAFTDNELAQEEQVLLGSFASGLGVEPARVDAMKQYAQAYILDQALAAAYAGGSRDEAVYAEAMQLGRSIGMSEEELRGIEARHG